MKHSKIYTVIGLMSGTSLDGEIDVALIRTDGLGFVEAIDFKPFPYPEHIRDVVRACFGKKSQDEQLEKAEKLVTDIHIDAVKHSGFKADLIGFHGQTITHDPDAGFTWQLGDGQRLATETGMAVVCQMRQSDIDAGGQGAPLIPIYHQALVADLPKSVAILNLGGVGNVTWVGQDADALLAFDTGPANALLDDYINATLGHAYDEGGTLASQGQVDQRVVSDFLDHSYFKLDPPKSLDRNEFTHQLSRLPDKAEDAMATLVALSVQGVLKAQEHFPERPKEWIICGGGRKNKTMMDALGQALDVPIKPIETYGWDGDAIEAQGFGYLAVRSILSLPISFPQTTAVPHPMTGGVFYSA